jgi:hypothetical protein
VAPVVRTHHVGTCLLLSVQLHKTHTYSVCFSVGGAGYETQGDREAIDKEADEQTSKMMSQLFGSNLQVVVWVCTLTYAGYTGYQQMQVNSACGRPRHLDRHGLRTPPHSTFPPGGCSGQRAC